MDASKLSDIFAKLAVKILEQSEDSRIGNAKSHKTKNKHPLVDSHKSWIKIRQLQGKTDSK